MKKISVWGVPWHVSHQASIAKLPFIKYSLLINPIRKWTTQSRPFPKDAKLVPYYEQSVEKSIKLFSNLYWKKIDRKYDVAILHLDQQIVDPALGKSKLFRALDKLITDIPKIIIEHGTPCWPEKYKTPYVVKKTKWLVRNASAVVVNSHQAAKDWWADGKGFKAIPIIHGMDPKDWYDLPKEPRVVTAISPAGLDKYYNRRLLDTVKQLLRERGIQHCHIMADVEFKNIEDYKRFLGRSLLYFNPTWQSPMPRARTEAMLSGCCIITTDNQDEPTFIQNGVNGFLVKNNPWKIADLIEDLLLHRYREALVIGQRGRETALERFDKKRFANDWQCLLERVLKRKI